MELEFEWDEAKAEANRRKHGITFELARTAFEDPVAIDAIDDRSDYGEERYKLIGLAEGYVLLTVVYAERLERIRIISARTASKNEQDEYHRFNATSDDRRRN